MSHGRYFMHDLNGRKVDSIMQFNVALRRNRPRSWFEFGLFLAALAAYLGVLAFTG